MPRTEASVHSRRPIDPAFRKALSSVFEDRSVVLVGAVAGRLSHIAGQCFELGAQRVLIVASESSGLGCEGLPPLTRVIAPISHMSDSVDSATGARSSVAQALQDFDPERKALVVSDGAPASRAFPGRTVLNPGFLSRTRLERKLSGESILEAVSNRTDLVRVLELTGPDIYRKCEEVDLGDGVVLASDPPHSPGTGGSHVRWVTSPPEFEAAARDLGIGTVVRAMPYLRGIPSSMHGLVLDDGILTCPPMQLVNLVRRPRALGESRSFFGAGAATLTHVGALASKRIRAVVMSVGRRLTEIANYRGLYCVDGILTADDFIPTEINMREGSSIGVAFSQQTQLPIQLLNAVASSNLVVGESAARLDRAVAASSAPGAAVTWHAFSRPATGLTVEGSRRVAEWHSSPHTVGPFVRQIAVTSGVDGRTRQVYVRGIFAGILPPLPPKLLELATEFWRVLGDELGVDSAKLDTPLT